MEIVRRKSRSRCRFVHAGVASRIDLAIARATTGQGTVVCRNADRFRWELEWIAETSDHVELGLSKDARGADDAGPLIVRVVVERRAAGTPDWKIVWATDVVARNQESVVLRSAEGAAPAALSLWAYRLPDGKVFVESDLTLSAAGRAIQSASTNILEDNRTTEVGTVDADGAESSRFSNRGDTRSRSGVNDEKRRILRPLLVGRRRRLGGGGVGRRHVKNRRCRRVRGRRS